MKIAVLADDDGEIVAVALCRMSLTGEVGSFTNDAEIRAEIRRSALDAYRGRESSTYSESEDDVISSITLDLPEELQDVSLVEVREQMVLDRSGFAPRLTRKAASS